MDKFRLVVIYLGLTFLFYFDIMMFWWIERYFQGEDLFPVLFFSVYGTIWSLLLFAIVPKGFNRWGKGALVVLALPPAITFVVLLV
jgi:hypothetical protein